MGDRAQLLNKEAIFSIAVSVEPGHYYMRRVPREMQLLKVRHDLASNGNVVTD